ncbi:MAG TPA: hypothetical protein VK543_16810 [Puia sp.]|nr:hypothetical protein [Puia sp.]
MKKGSKRKITFIVAFCCLISEIPALAQTRVVMPLYASLPDKLVFAAQAQTRALSAGYLHPGLGSKPRFSSSFIALQTGWQGLPADFYTRDFGFFCKKELEFEKMAHVPLKFRLGSLDYCNYLEGK